MTIFQASRVLRHAHISLSSVALAGALAACGLLPTAGPAADGAGWKKTCPSDKLVEYVGFDISKSSAPHPFGSGQDQWPVVQDAVARAAVCKGHLLVTAFAGSSANPVQLYDGEPSLPGATDQARFRKLNETVEQLSGQIANVYNEVISGGGFSGSDIIGQLRLASEYAEQIGQDGTKVHLSTTIVTDGLQSVSTKRFLIRNTDDARSYADSVAVPKHDGELLFTGLGDRIDGKQVSTTTVENLKAIYTRICERTGAQPCQAVTDYTSPVTGEND